MERGIMEKLYAQIKQYLILELIGITSHIFMCELFIYFIYFVKLGLHILTKHLTH